MCTISKIKGNELRPTFFSKKGIFGKFLTEGKGVFLFEFLMHTYYQNCDFPHNFYLKVLIWV